jgi:hypothetical protein
MKKVIILFVLLFSTQMLMSQKLFYRSYKYAYIYDNSTDNISDPIDLPSTILFNTVCNGTLYHHLMMNNKVIVFKQIDDAKDGIINTHNTKYQEIKCVDNDNIISTIILFDTGECSIYTVTNGKEVTLIFSNEKQ